MSKEKSQKGLEDKVKLHCRLERKKERFIKERKRKRSNTPPVQQEPRRKGEKKKTGRKEVIK